MYQQSEVNRKIIYILHTSYVSLLKCEVKQLQCGVCNLCLFMV